MNFFQKAIQCEDTELEIFAPNHLIRTHLRQAAFLLLSLIFFVIVLNFMT